MPSHPWRGEAVRRPFDARLTPEEDAIDEADDAEDDGVDVLRPADLWFRRRAGSPPRFPVRRPRF